VAQNERHEHKHEHDRQQHVDVRGVAPQTTAAPLERGSTARGVASQQREVVTRLRRNGVLRDADAGGLGR
jgi:hypothetical protein